MTWKMHPDLPGVEVSDRGEVRQHGRLIPQNARGAQGTAHPKSTESLDACLKALRVRLKDGDRSTIRSVHLLVLETFVGPRPERSFGLHTNGNVQDNRVENLTWSTYEKRRAAR